METHLGRFNLSAFRPGQREVISALFDGHDCLCIMPTGGGKSLCYQLPAVAREGLTLVVSPLIALMKDQVDSLTALGIAATYINSSLSPADAYQRIEEMAAGRYDLVYIAPERLRSSLFLEKLRETKVQLLAVDEAHCISEWGHDFRPDYARLGRLRQRLNFPQTIGLTATATPDVRQDIIAQLRLRDSKTFITGFSRPNLHFEVQQVLSEPDRDRILFNFLRETPGSGIIYSATRKGCEQLAPQLAAISGRRVDLYHAGLESDVRRRVQDDFMSGKTPIIVATNAFGMGIDKPDLRFVVHYNIPGTLEAYYQEAGRAGRDGLSSRCLLLYSHRDRRIQEYFIDSAYPEPEIVAAVYDFLRGIDEDPIELTLEEIRERLNLPVRSEGVSACEKLLENCKALERLDARQNMAAVRIDSDLPTLVDLLPKEAKVQRRVLQAVERRVGGQRYERVYFSPRQIAHAAEIDIHSLNRALRELSKLQAFDFVPPFRGRAVHMLERKKPFEQLGIDFEEQQRRKDAEYAKLDRMIRYATSRRCRQVEILDYFGDENRRECATCDNCKARESADRTNKTDGTDRAYTPHSSHQSHTPSSSTAPDLSVPVRIALSGVARAKGRFGKQMIARMLIGSKAKDVEKYKLNKLSTFGLLRHLTEPQAGAFLDALLGARLLQQVEKTPHRPLLQLTPLGEDVMKGRKDFTERLHMPDHVFARLQSGHPSPSQQKRGDLSRQAPVISACGPVIDADDEINTILATEGEEPTESSTAAAGQRAHQPTHYWTWRLFSSGFSADECQHIRSLDGDTVIQHVLSIAKDGLDFHPSWVLSSDQYAVLSRLVANGAPKSLASLLSRLPNTISPAAAEIFWHHHSRK